MSGLEFKIEIRGGNELYKTAWKECEDWEGKESKDRLRALQYLEIQLCRRKKQKWLRQRGQWLGRKLKAFVLKKLRKARILNIEIEWIKFFLGNIHEPFLVNFHLPPPLLLLPPFFTTC